jgi:hypothetical protein
MTHFQLQMQVFESVPLWESRRLTLIGQGNAIGYWMRQRLTLLSFTNLSRVSGILKPFLSGLLDDETNRHDESPVIGCETARLDAAARGSLNHGA